MGTQSFRGSSGSFAPDTRPMHHSGAMWRYARWALRLLESFGRLRRTETCRCKARLGTAGPGIRRIRLGKIPEGGAQIDVRRKTLGAWQTADTIGFFQPYLSSGPGGRPRSGRTDLRSTSKGARARFLGACDLVRSTHAESAYLSRSVVPSAR